MYQKGHEIHLLLTMSRSSSSSNNHFGYESDDDEFMDVVQTIILTPTTVSTVGQLIDALQQFSSNTLLTCKIGYPSAIVLNDTIILADLKQHH